MMSLDKKIESLHKLNEEFLTADIAEFEALLSDNQGDKEVVQSALTNVKKEFKDIQYIPYLLGYYPIENLSIVDIDSGVNYKKGLDYSIDHTVGEIIILPNGTIVEGVNIVASFDVKEYLYESISWGFASIQHRGKPRDEIIALKKEAEAKLSDNYKLHPIGYPYFNDVYYLDIEDYEFLKDHEKLRGDEKILDLANYLAYLYWYIKRLKTTQKNTVKKRALTPPIKEIMKVLKYLEHEHEATVPLIKLLATFEDDYRNDIVSYKDRILYIVEKEAAQAAKIKPLQLNMDQFANLKNKYKQKITEFYNLMKQHNPRNYKKPTKDLLKELKLPHTPSKI